MKLILITITVLLFNIPFGYWRAGVKKFSLQWFLAVHLPVPFIIVLRIYSGIGFAFYTYIFLVGAFFGGQQTGAFYRKKKQRLININPQRELSGEN